MTFKHTFETKFGTLTAYERNDFLVRLCFDSTYDGEYRKTRLLNDVEQQITEYCNGSRINFNIPIQPVGTEFQKKIWSLLMSIPYGQTRSYQDIASEYGNAKACRAVGNANNKNPIMIIIPCHRVIGKNGFLTGYAAGIDIKNQLLEHEKNLNERQQYNDI